MTGIDKVFLSICHGAVIAFVTPRPPRGRLHLHLLRPPQQLRPPPSLQLPTRLVPPPDAPPELDKASSSRSSIRSRYKKRSIADRRRARHRFQFSDQA